MKQRRKKGRDACRMNFLSLCVCVCVCETCGGNGVAKELPSESFPETFY